MTAPRASASGGQIQQMGKTLVGQLFMVLRTVRIHDSFNQAMLLATENLKDQLNTVWSTLGSVKLEFIEDQVYLNDTRLRLDAQSLDNVKELAGDFRGRGLGGLAFRRPVTTEGIRELVKVFMEARPGDKDAAAAMRRQLLELRNLALDVLGPRSFASGKGPAPKVEIDPRLWALQTYAKAVLAVRRFVGEDDGSPVDPRMRLTRIVQDLVDISAQESNLLVRMCSIKEATDYVYHHAVNTAVLSLAMGQALGLGRVDLVDLGLAALCADLGFTQGNMVDVLDKKDLTEQDRANLSQHSLRAVRLLLGKGALNRSAMRRIVVAFQHHVHFDRKGGYPEAQRRSPLHLFSRITAIADSYDALTTNRAWREAFPPAEALQIMKQDAGSKFDPSLLRVFINLLGIFPLGMKVQLNTGELGEIYHVQDRPELWGYPIVRITHHPQGNPVTGRTLLRDLTERDEDGTNVKYWIQGCLE